MPTSPGRGRPPRRKDAKADPRPSQPRPAAAKGPERPPTDGGTAADEPQRWPLFAITAPGLEPVAERELRALGIANPRAEVGGVAFSGRAEHLYRANLWLRTASRVVVRMGDFRATTFRDLEREARQLPWARFVTAGQPVRFRVTCRKSKLYHSDAVAERLVGALARQLGAEPAVELLTSEEGDAGESLGAETPAATPQLFVARFLHDRCTVSADSSGALLHLRGYRQAVAKAPLRETLAAALLLGAGWDGTRPLVDPMCGSGTIAIEGALIARRMAPGARRPFAFMQWPGFDANLWRSMLSRAERDALEASPVPILASDRDAGAIAAAAANAERAGVAGDVTIATHALSHAAPPVEGGTAGLVAVNPPYGVRVGDQDRLRNLYAQFGKLLDARFGGWRVALLSADRALERQVGLELHEALRTSNGGIPVRVVVGEVAPQGTEHDADRPARPAGMTTATREEGAAPSAG